MLTQTLRELSKQLQQKKISSLELTSAYLNQIAALNPLLNAYITVCEETALNQAKKADELIAKQQAHPLCGIPVAHKDIFCTQDIRTTCGSKMLDNFIAPYDATIIKNCQDAGCVMLGKTNMDEFAMGSSNENSYYGAVKNPWDLTTVPGGSSGGSAAAVAAGLCAAASGSDTGGSIRQPAAFCGLTGLKPTYGLVSRYGMIAFASSLDQAGPMTRSAECAALWMNVLAGFDPNDSTSVEIPTPDYTAQLTHSLKNKTIGLPKQFFNPNLSATLSHVFDNAIAEFKKMGVNFVEVDLPHHHAAIAAYYIIAPAEASSNLARYDGVRYGYRCKNPRNLDDLYKRTRSEGFGDEVKRRIMIGTYALSAGYYDAFYLKAQKIRRLISQDFAKAFQQVDFILSPTVANTAFKLGEKKQDPLSMYLADNYGIGVNLAGIPSIAFPVGFSDNMPLGMQLIGNHFSETLLLNAAHQYQQVSDWHLRTPDLIK
ncbi:MAG: Asp-tRNA(Asn)/Glu-tRNA(Gln) amidotransferase subunit GatA [Legionellales bacterium]|nr:Asp-tRNA(Asn)/Glu-tRNA(Gln) amidotransferase subunit GatA [Legionellales bacterium]